MVMCNQVVGFLVLVSGTSLYNELIRSCLPGMFDRLDDSDAEASACPAYTLLPFALACTHFCSCRFATLQTVCHARGLAFLLGYFQGVRSNTKGIILRRSLCYQQHQQIVE